MKIIVLLKSFLLLVGLYFCNFAQVGEHKSFCQDDSDLLLDKNGKPVLFAAEQLRSKIVQHQSPKYPQACRCAGNVQILARVNTNGKIDCHSFVAGHPLLKASVSDVLPLWEFQPIYIKEKPVSVLTIITFTFGDSGIYDNITEPKELPCPSQEKVLKDRYGKPVWVSLQELEQMAVHKIYPVRDTHLKKGGSLFTDILVNRKGEVVCVKVANGHPILRGAALTAAKQWKFKPMVVNEKPIAFFGRLLFHISSY